MRQQQQGGTRAGEALLLLLLLIVLPGIQPAHLVLVNADAMLLDADEVQSRQVLGPDTENGRLIGSAEQLLQVGGGNAYEHLGQSHDSIAFGFVGCFKLNAT